jgi:sodium transport system permease protein
MNRHAIWVLYMRELRSALRERSIVVNSILIPIFLYPLLMWLVYTAMTFVSGQTDDLRSRVTLSAMPQEFQRLGAEIETSPNIELQQSLNPEEDIRFGNLDAYIEIGPNGKMRVAYDASQDRSVRAHARVVGIVDRYREQFLQEEALNLGVTREQYQGFWIEDVNVSSDVERGRFVLGLLLPMLLVVMLAVGGLYPAIDTTAGERENSTWETLMTLATSRTNILVAKYLYVATMSFVAGALNVTAMMLSMKSILAPFGEASNSASFKIPLASVPVLMLGAALLALFLAAGMMILASFARTFKEGQSMVSPFYVAIIMPIMFMQGSAQHFTLNAALVPVLNVTIMFRDAILGSYNWPLIGVTTLVEAIAIILALRLSLAILKYEEFVIGCYGGNFGKFLKERLLK